VLVEVAVEGHPFLPAVGRVVGAVEIEQDPVGRTLPTARAEVELDQRGGEPFGVGAVDVLLQAGESRLANGTPLSGSRPQASLRSGSLRKQSVSSWSA
jgi:hypothetical protein